MPDFYSWIAIAVAVLAFALGAQVLGVTGLLALIVAGLLALTLVAAAAGSRARRHLARPDPRFEATDEVFRDPSSGIVTRVFVDPKSGERRYRQDS